MMKKEINEEEEVEFQGQNLIEDEVDDVLEGSNYCIDDKTFTVAGLRRCGRRLQCPCAKPRVKRTVKNPTELRSIELKVPAVGAKRYSRPDNVVITSKYTPWDFFPRAMALQFRRAVNLFYLFQVVLLIIGYFFPSVYESPFTPFGTILVLAFVLGVTLITEFKDDRARHRADAKTNGKAIYSINPQNGKQKKTTWGELVPGDLIFLKNRDLVPADILLVKSSQPGGFVYIETSGIDGETNLKIRQVPHDLKNALEKASGNQLHNMVKGTLKYEEPNPFLSFSGSFESDDKTIPKFPLQFENLILRGSEVRNECYGLVCYAGHETKLVLSKRATPSKFSTLDYLINRIVFLCLLQLLVMTIISDIVLFSGTLPRTADIRYFQFTDTTSIFDLPGPVAFFLTFFVIYGNLVPINLYVVFEVTTGVQSWLLCQDVKMYDPGTDTRAGSKSTNLISEIGQVSHIFSDKTGTLTQNVMRLVGCSLNSKRYGVKVPDAVAMNNNPDIEGGFGRSDDEETVLGKRNLVHREVFKDLLREASTPTVIEFLTTLAVCHTVVMDKDDQGNPRYNAEGPDEEALVKAAAALGFVLKSTSDNRYEIFIESIGRTQKFEVLAVNAFDSDRKRMSILVKDTDTGKYELFLKGADSVVAERTPLRKAPPKLQSDLDAFAQAGLRTLLVAKRPISQGEAERWLKEHSEVKLLIGHAKKEALDRLAEELETNLDLIGATAIEDALQEGVPETIQALRDSGIKVWVLTGDKVDTAVNIGYSSKLLEPPSQMPQILIDQSTTQEAVQELELKIAKHGINDKPIGEKLALILTGKAVECLLAKQKGTVASQNLLLQLANSCSVVLACRVSPAQKALIVRAATQSARKRGARPVVSLAIGDGANDVAMIQEAKVGVGISGKEGLQAVNSADFSIAQFKFLHRLLFVHGRWSYRRSSSLVLFVLYSWQVLNWPIFFYNFYCLFSGQQVYIQTFYITAFAWLIHYLPLLSSFFDRDISSETVLSDARSYDLGRKNQLLDVKAIVIGMFLRSLLHAAIFFFILISVFPLQADVSVFGSTIYMGLMVIIQLREVMSIFSWVWITLWGFLLWFIAYPFLITLVDIVFGDGPILPNEAFPSAYLNCFLLLGIFTLVEYSIHGFRRTMFPTYYEVLIEKDRGYGSQDVNVQNRPTPPRFNGMGILPEVFGQGIDNTLVLAASRCCGLTTPKHPTPTNKQVLDVQAADDHV